MSRLPRRIIPALILSVLAPGAVSGTSGTAAVSAISSNTIVLDAPVRERVAVDAALSGFFDSRKRGLTFVFR